MMGAPLMTCSARLPVYVLLIGLLVPSGARFGPFGAQGLVMFALYLVGALSAMATAWLFSRIGRASGPLLPFYMEMPPYRVPSARSVLLAVWDACKGFLRKVGKIILGTTVVLWLLLNLPAPSDASSRAAGVDPQDRTAVSAYTIDHSAGAAVGRFVEPVFAPLGLRLADQRRRARLALGAGGLRRHPRAGRGGRAARPARGRAEEDDRAGGAPRRGAAVHRAGARGPARVLPLRPAVHVDDRRAAPRVRLVEVAGDRLRLPVRRRLDDGAARPHRGGAGDAERARPGPSRGGPGGPGTAALGGARRRARVRGRACGRPRAAGRAPCRRHARGRRGATGRGAAPHRRGPRLAAGGPAGPHRAAGRPRGAGGVDGARSTRRRTTSCGPRWSR